MGYEEFAKERQKLKKGKEINRVNDDICDISLELLQNEYENGVQMGVSTGIHQLDDTLKYLRGTQNCYTGYPNEGKTTFTLYLMVLKSLRDGWKWCFWSPEMKSASFYNGKVQVHYNDLINEIIEIITGKTVYKTISEKYNIERVGLNEYLKQAEWVNKHFICLDPKNNHIDHIYDLLLKTYDNHGYDGILIDPFKNVRMDEGGREDQKLDALFSKFKNLAVETNTVMNWIAHPRSKVDRIKDDQKMPCDQYMLAGGAAWDNNMDGIYSVLRPNSHLEPNDPIVHFYNLKQRKQKFTTKKGMYPFIEYDIKTQRYIFDKVDPLQTNGFKKLPQTPIF